MKKFILTLWVVFLVFVFTTVAHSQFYIGKILLKDSAGTLVIVPPPGGGFKVNQEHWVKTKDIDSNFASVGLSYNKNFGLRFNAGNGLEIGSGDTVVSTGEVSLLSVDSIHIGNGKISYNPGNGSLLQDTVSFQRINLFNNGAYGRELIFHNTPAWTSLIQVNAPYMQTMNFNNKIEAEGYNFTFSANTNPELGSNDSLLFMIGTSGDSTVIIGARGLGTDFQKLNIANAIIIEADGSIRFNSSTNVDQKFYFNGSMRLDGITTSEPSTTEQIITETMNVFGSNEGILLGRPVDWLIINIDGTDRKIPLY